MAESPEPWCQRHGLIVKPTTVAAAVQSVAAVSPVHPLRNRLDGLAWDGVERLDNWLSDYLGVTKTPYSTAVGRAWMISAVARTYRPGCKVDHALILEGPQGPGKSTIAEILALDREWFTDEIADLGSKDSAQGLPGKWVIELAELSAMRRNEVERTKAFFSRSVDHYRPSYGRRAQDFPRRCVFIGSTNAHEYLADQTGNRRFWPVRIGTVDLTGLRLDVGPLWAEAVAAYRSGEQWWLDAATEPVAADEQEKRRKVDAWEQDVLRWAWDILKEQPGRVTIGALLERAIGMPLKDRDQAAATRVGNILTAAGWTRRAKRVDGRFTRY